MEALIDDSINRNSGIKPHLFRFSAKILIFVLIGFVGIS